MAMKTRHQQVFVPDVAEIKFVDSLEFCVHRQCLLLGLNSICGPSAYNQDWILVPAPLQTTYWHARPKHSLIT